MATRHASSRPGGRGPGDWAPAVTVMRDDPRLAPLIAECRRRVAAGADDAALAAWLRAAVPSDCAAADIVQAALGCDADEARRIAGSAGAGPRPGPGLSPVPDARAARPARSFGRRPDVTGPGRESRESPRPRAGVEAADEESGDRGAQAPPQESLDDPAQQPAALDSIPIQRREDPPPPAAGAGPGPDPDRPASPPRPASEAELAQAARRLGIQFRDSGIELPTDLRDGSHDEVVRKLGIRFRDDEPQTEPASVADDLSLEAERLGIRFREPGKLPRKATPGLTKYWFWIALAVALAVIMPVLVQSVGPFVAHLSE